MTSSIFLAKNLAILFISMQSLDPCTGDKVLQESSLLTVNQLFELKNTDLTVYEGSSNKHNLRYLIILTEILFTISSQIHIQKAVNLTLREFGSKKSNSKIAKNYVKRFAGHYYKTFKPYLIGYNRYHNYHWIKKISVINLLILQKLPKSDGHYRVLLYLLYNSSNS
uniref:hypothetical protein n=1 Tax=Rhodochorton tenue TaxID=173034 RepID=UPI002A7FD473|nr:hypothetical protein UYM82_pgp165 [Rhodochorton tenue]WOK79410.1 hypothetical protein [Rhodochorton tenue]